MFYLGGMDISDSRMAQPPEASTDELASPLFHDPAGPVPGPEASDAPARPLPPSDPDEFAFASPAEENAYWAGVCDGIRNAGGKCHPRLEARARDSYPELVATAEELTGRRPADLLGFDPVSVRHRIDGWTPERQREYVEALADSGVSRYAAARVGMSEQSVARLRRRADARSFDLACEAAQRIGARRIRSIAYERAIEGTIRRHYYHGELKSEERVFDNRLLVYLLGKLDKVLEPPEESRAVEGDWDRWMQAVEQGAPPPLAAPSGAEEGDEVVPVATDEDEEAGEFDGSEVWQSDGLWWTDFPPPEGFDGIEEGEFGDDDYRRTLSDAELAVVEADEAEERTADLAEQSARRDRWFGFEGGSLSSFKEAELYEPFEPSGGEDGSAEETPALPPPPSLP